MIKVITYGTYDLLHYGHIRLLERAKALGDYLIVGVTADDFDKVRGKINVQQSLMERIDAVRATGIADEIIVEEYEGQKIDDIKRYDVDIFTVGSDWRGTFDYLNEYCKVVYLDRTEGISSSEIREQKRQIRLGLAGELPFLKKIYNESHYVNGLKISGLCTKNVRLLKDEQIENRIEDYDAFLDAVDAIFIKSNPKDHYEKVKQALLKGKHVLCESPIALKTQDIKELVELANEQKVILMEGIKTAYSTAFSRLILLLKGGIIGKIVSVDAICTSLKKDEDEWPGFYEWAPTALIPVFQVLGTDYSEIKMISCLNESREEAFTKVDFLFEHAVASIKVGNGVKAEGELIISGTKGYAYVPAPWWKTDYFEIRYEDQSQNKRYFYQLDGEGIRYELVAFARSIEKRSNNSNIDTNISVEIAHVFEDHLDCTHIVI